MKRKLSPAELSVEDKLKLLYQLQTVLSEIDRIRTLRGELPLEVEDLEDEVAGLNTRMERTHKEIAELRSTVNALKGDIEIANGKINTYKEQLDNVRNNREYDTLNKEIEFQTLEVELCNKKIREAINAERQKEELLVASQNLLDERMQDLEVKKNELDEIVKPKPTRRSCARRQRTSNWPSNRTSCVRSSASARAAVTVWVSCMCSATHVAVASHRFLLSVSSTCASTRKSSFANTAAAFSSTQSWQV